MVRLVVALGIVAFALPARATELPHRVGLYAPGNAALPMTQSKVAVTVRGPIVEATVTQTFTNDRDRAIEATYIFPLPADAAVSAMSIDVGDEHIHAAIARRDEAQRRYEEAVSAGKGAAQLDQERPDIFTQSISAIPPHGTVSVTLRFDSTAHYADGTWQLVLPLVVAPRYAPGTASGRPTTGTGRSPDTDRSPDASRVTPGGSPGAGGSTAIAIEFADAVEDVTSPTHELAREGTRYTLADPKSDHDAIVRWRAKLPSAGWVEQDDDSGYAAVVVAAPPAAANAHAAELVLLVDRGATMHGDADAVERPLVRALLGACDRASVSGGITTDGAPADVQKTLDAGWSELRTWDLTKVLAATHVRKPIVLVTDGLTTDDRAAIAAAQKVGAPIHVIGVGPAPNRSLLAAIAQATGGTVRFALPGDDLAAIARDVVSDTSTPMAPLSITWGTLAASDIVPAVLPRVGAGQSALVLARVKKAERANARARGDVFQLGMINTARPPAGATTPRGALARRWARLELDELVASGSSDKITAHALAYGLVSPTTSMIAVGEQVVVQGGVKHTVAVPVSVPEGMRWQEVQRATRVVIDGKNAEDQRARELDKKKPDRVAEKTEPKPKPKKAPPREEDEPRKEKKHADYDEDDNDGDDDAPAHRSHGGRKSTTQKPPIATGPVATTPVSPQPAAPPAADTGGAEAPAPPPREPTMSKEEVATIDGEGASEDIVLTSEASPAIARRLALSLGAGLAIEHGRADFASALTARYEVGHRTLVGIEGGLWVVGSDVQGDVLATFARRHIARIVELGAGAGLHLGGGVGPAFDLVLRTRLPVRHLALFLRYDGALLFHDNTKDGQNTTTIGVETTW